MAISKPIINRTAEAGRLNIVRLALFDFDGTLTRGDSFRRFIVYSNSISRLLKNIIPVITVLFLYSLGFYSNGRAKEKIFRMFFAGCSIEELREKAEGFVKYKLPKIYKDKIINKMIWHSKRGDRVILVSASFEFYLQYFCKTFMIELIGTKVKEENGIIAGEFLTPNCYGEEKVLRIKEQLDMSKYYIFAYGNSKGDYAMLNCADEAFVISGSRIKEVYCKPL